MVCTMNKICRYKTVDTVVVLSSFLKELSTTGLEPVERVPLRGMRNLSGGTRQATLLSDLFGSLPKNGCGSMRFFKF